MGSATLFRTALAGAVVCLIAVGVTAPALAGAGDGDGPCPDVGSVEALLRDGTCAEEKAAEEKAEARTAPGALLNPQFPDFPDYPGLDDGDDEGSDRASDEDPGKESDSGKDDGKDDEDEKAEARDAADEDSAEKEDEATTAAAVTVPTTRPRAAASGADESARREKAQDRDATAATPQRRTTEPEEQRPAPEPVHDTPAANVAPPAAPAAEHSADLAAVAFATSFPSPVQASWNVGAVLPSLVLTLLLLAALALPVGLLNRAAAEQPDRVESLLARLRVPPGAGGPAPGAFLTAVAITAVAGAVMLGFLTPQFPFDTSAPALLVGLAVAFILVTAAQQGTQLLYVARWWGVHCHVGPVPGFLLLGAVGVVLSRAIGLEPGLVLGTLIAFRTVRPLRTDEEGPAVALAATALTALGGTAWILREPLVAAAGAPGTFLADVVATTLTATAVSAAANLLFALVPLSFLPGSALLRWSPALWALFACTGGFAFVHLAVRPAADALTGRAGALGVLLAVYLVVAAGLWVWLRYGAGWALPRFRRAASVPRS